MLAILPASLLLWLRLQTEDRLSELVHPPVPVLVAATDVVIDDAQSVSARIVWDEVAALGAPPWSGTVTAVIVEAGDLLATGDHVATVDGVARIALRTKSPFFRSIAQGMTGADIADLQRALATLGFYEGEVDGTAGPTTGAAIRQLAESLGVVRPSGAFDPGWVVWLPEDRFEVDVVLAIEGRPAPTPGDDLLLGPATVSDVSFVDQDGRPVPMDGLWMFELGEFKFEVVDGDLTEAGKHGLAATVSPDTTEVSGRVRRAEGVAALSIPATAVSTNSDGDLCVWIPDGPSFRPRSVAAFSGRVAQVFVTEGLVADEQVLANPNDYLGSPVCP